MNPETPTKTAPVEASAPAEAAPPSAARRERERRRAARRAESAGKAGRRNQEVDFVPGGDSLRHRRST